MSARGPAYRLVRPPAAPDTAPAPDAAQRAVVEHTAGPLLVIGGPGTGKTSTLIAAVAARVAAGTDPERILVLTFGRRGAAALRRRIERRVAVTGTVHEPLVRTFHAYAFGLLRHAAAARGEAAPRLLTGPEQDVIIRALLAGAAAAPGAADAEPPPDGSRWPPQLRPALRTRAFAGQLRDLLLRAVERGIGPAELAAMGQRLRRADWPAAAQFLREYHDVLALREATGRGSVGYDYAELVRAAVGLLEGDPALLAAQRQRLRFIYVDEYADTDPAQRDLLALVAGGGAPLVVFADPDSSTFAFRGGDPDGVREFPDRFRTVAGRSAPTVLLGRSFRAGTDLLASMARIGRRLRGPARHRTLRADPAAAPGTVEVVTFRSPASEHGWLAQRLRQAHLRAGIPWREMAVLVRAGSQLALVQRALRAAGVPTVTHAEDLPLHAQPAVAPLLLLLRCALEPQRLDEEAAVTLLHSPLGGADPFAERRLRQGLRALAVAAGDHRGSGELLVAALRDPAELAMVERRWAAPAKAVAALLATARQAAAAPGATAEDVLWAVWRASGLAERWYAATRRRAGEGPWAPPGTPAPDGGRAPAGPPGGDGAPGSGGVPGSGGGWGGDGWRAEAADRDLDAIVVLFDAAARFTDRLPGARVEVFLDHVLGQHLPADTLAPTADRGDAVRLLTAHAAKGLEWDLVAIPGVQEGVWPDLRLRGSLLGAEQLVDAYAGRELGVAGQVSALLDEERRLFWVAISRARALLLVSAVAAASVGEAEGEEQPSRFLRELTDAGQFADPGDAMAVLAEPAEPAGSAGSGDSAGSAGSGDSAGSGAAAGAGAPTGAVDVAEGPAAADEPEPPELPVGRVPRGLTLPALVAELRTAVADPTAALPQRQAAAAQLARLAAAGVPGAHPDQWWGLAPLSDDRPLVDPGETVRVTPSTMESALRCSLRWLLEKHGGAAPFTAAQGVGNLVHAAAMLADEATGDRNVLVQWMGERFDAIEHAAAWLAGPERDRAEAMVDKLMRWIATNPRRLAAIEQDFTVRLDGDADANPVELRGRVDRLELDEAGRLVVIDLKTGKAAPASSDIAEHAQLGAYQAAVAAGAFPEHGTEPGGAALVQLGTTNKEAREQAQPPLAAAEDPGWAGALVRRTGAVMAASTFSAVRNDRCRVCPVRACCPVSGKGRQVVQP